MKYCSKNELNCFDYKDCICHSVVIDDKGMELRVEALIVKSQNSQNSNFTDSYAGDTVINIIGANIEKIVKEGYKYYDANDVLISTCEDEEMRLDLAQTTELLSKTFLINAEAVDDNRIVLEFEIPNEEPAAVTDVYELTMKAEEVEVAWDSYMNRA